MHSSTEFPRIQARNLEGLEVMLPDAFTGERNVVIVAFQRKHQSLVDSWVPWLQAQASADPGLRFYEVPTIGRIWAPVRNMIDGGMAKAIGDPVVLQRTLTVYGDVGRLTRPLGIQDRSTITLTVVDRGGRVHWSGAGAFEANTAKGIDAALEAMRGGPPGGSG